MRFDFTAGILRNTDPDRGDDTAAGKDMLSRKRLRQAVRNRNKSCSVFHRPRNEERAARRACNRGPQPD
ncbi:MAG: hypothetical protein WBA51_18425 [Erythrobacter sp.]